MCNIGLFYFLRVVVKKVKPAQQPEHKFVINNKSLRTAVGLKASTCDKFNIMKNLYVSLLIVLAFPFSLLAQNIHGIWTGTLVNDSTHRFQDFELGLSEYNGKITGYTYTTFINNDTFYCSVKRIKAERKDGNLVVEDVEMIWNNFPQRAAKGVKQTTTFPLINDSTIDISKGRWSTNQTKKYYSIGGSAAVKEKNDDEESELLSHLQELKVKTDIAGKKEKKKEEPVAINQVKLKPQQANEQKPSESKNNDVVKNSVQTSPLSTSPKTVNSQKADSVQSLAVSNKKKETDLIVAENKPTQQQPGKNNSATSAAQKTDKPDVAAPKKKEQTVAAANTNMNKPAQPPVFKNDVAANVGGIQSGNGNNSTLNKSSQTQAVESRKPEVVQVSQRNDQSAGSKPVEQKINSAVSINKPVSQQKEMAGSAKELPPVVADRKNETIQDIYFKNDSLILSLYDNGIVDGDTVSVFMNGENIISKQKLKESAIKKTIYVSPNSDTLQLVLFAENLGTIPPNTGLLTIRDGDDVYQVRFSADLQKNASIMLRKKK